MLRLCALVLVFVGCAFGADHKVAAVVDAHGDVWRRRSLVRQGGSGASDGESARAAALQSSSVRTLGSVKKKNDRSDFVVVVTNFQHRKNVTWLRGLVSRVDEVGVDSPRSISESGPTFSWVFDNYDELPERVAFLHGDRKSWHLAQFSEAIFRDHPGNDPITFSTGPTDNGPGGESTSSHSVFDKNSLSIHMLADRSCVWARELISRYAKKELPGLNYVHRAFLGETFAETFEKYDMALHFVCCAEHLSNKRILHKFPKAIYGELVKVIHEFPEQRWAWVFEYSYQILFSNSTAMLPNDEILRRLRMRPIEGIDSAGTTVGGPSGSPSSLSVVELETQSLLNLATRCGSHGAHR